MDAAFTYAAVYNVDARCVTPLRTGGTDGDTERVLRRKDGAAFLQGASLAGALRDWLEKQEGAGPAQALFGSPKQAGRLVVSDAEFARDAAQYTRPRLRIDPKTAAAAEGAKFDLAHISAGARLSFTLVWLGTAETKGELETVEAMLSALNAGEIRLGAQKSDGFGQLTLSPRRRLFDMTRPEDRRAWLEDRWEGEAFALPAPPERRTVTFTVTGRFDNVLVKSALELRQEGEQTYTVTPNLSEYGAPLLPGSSVKGAVRARASYIAAVLGLGDAFVENAFGRTGDSHLPGLVRFSDVTLDPAQKAPVTRIRVDRFTGGMITQGRFIEEPVGARATLRVDVPADKPALCGLLLYALRDLGLGLYNLGSGWGIGRGQMEVAEIRAEAPGGRSDTLRFDEDRRPCPRDPGGLFQTWLEKLEEARHEN